MEKINYIVGYENLKIYQESDEFKFSLDSILLANFSKQYKKPRMLDIGTGSCIIPLLLSDNYKTIDAVEIQEKQYNLAKKSIECNNINNINLINDDINEYYNKIPSETYDVITCNPPYFKVLTGSHLNDVEAKQIARHEIKLNIEDIFKISKKILKNNGVISIVHRPERLIEIFENMKKNNIEPKKLWFIYPKINKDSNIVIISGSKNGKPGLEVLPPLFVHNDDGSYTEEVKKYFC